MGACFFMYVLSVRLDKLGFQPSNQLSSRYKKYVAFWLELASVYQVGTYSGNSNNIYLRRLLFSNQSLYLWIAISDNIFVYIIYKECTWLQIHRKWNVIQISGVFFFRFIFFVFVLFYFILFFLFPKLFYIQRRFLRMNNWMPNSIKRADRRRHC